MGGRWGEVLASVKTGADARWRSEIQAEKDRQ